MSQISGRQEAIQSAILKLRSVDLAQRCMLLGLPVPEKGQVPLRIFGRDYILGQDDYSLVLSDGDKPAKEGDHILVLHYLLHDTPIQPSGQLISFRDFPGGQFYWQPFLSRTAFPLLQKVGDDRALLQKNLGRFDWEPFPLGDFGARVQALGKFNLYLGYHCGDEEFPAAVDILFDSCIKRVFCAEDASAMASRICLGLV